MGIPASPGGSTTGLNADSLVRASKLTAKIDNTAVQDGFQLYLHSFILSSEGDWTVVQQGMNSELGEARRYHWHSPRIRRTMRPVTIIHPATNHSPACVKGQGKCHG